MGALSRQMVGDQFPPTETRILLCRLGLCQEIRDETQTEFFVDMRSYGHVPPLLPLRFYRVRSPTWPSISPKLSEPEGRFLKRLISIIREPKFKRVVPSPWGGGVLNFNTTAEIGWWVRVPLSQRVLPESLGGHALKPSGAVEPGEARRGRNWEWNRGNCQGR